MISAGGARGPGAAGDEVTAPGRVGGSFIPRATAGQEAPEEPYFGHLEIQVMAEALFYRGLRGLSKGRMADKKQSASPHRTSGPGSRAAPGAGAWPGGAPHCYFLPSITFTFIFASNSNIQYTNHEPNTCYVQGPRHTEPIVIGIIA